MGSYCRLAEAFYCLNHLNNLVGLLVCGFVWPGLCGAFIILYSLSCRNTNGGRMKRDSRLMVLAMLTGSWTITSCYPDINSCCFQRPSMGFFPAHHLSLAQNFPDYAVSGCWPLILGLIIHCLVYRCGYWGRVGRHYSGAIIDTAKAHAHYSIERNWRSIQPHGGELVGPILACTFFRKCNCYHPSIVSQPKTHRRGDTARTKWRYKKVIMQNIAI